MTRGFLKRTTTIRRLLFLCLAGLFVTQAKAETLWVPAESAQRVSSTMIRGSDAALIDKGSIGDFIAPLIYVSDATNQLSCFAEFQISVPKAGTYYAWARWRTPVGVDDLFALAPAEKAERSGDNLSFTGKSQNREWQWSRLSIELPSGPFTFRIYPRHASATVYHPQKWRQAEPAFSPHLNLFCFTTDSRYVPTDPDARAALPQLESRPGLSRKVEPATLPKISDDEMRSLGKMRVVDWMRCPRFYTKDPGRHQPIGKHAGDIAQLVRQIAACDANALRLGVAWGGEVYYQSRIAPHAPGLGNLDHLREAVEEGARNGVKIIAYINPNALYSDHPLYPECGLRLADGKNETRQAYGGDRPTSYYACINHPRYRQFLADMLREMFTNYNADGLYVDGLTPHVCFCQHCRQKYREMFGADMPVEKFGRTRARITVWSEMSNSPVPLGSDEDSGRWTKMMYRSLVEVTHLIMTSVKNCRPEAVVIYHSYPKPDCMRDYDGTLTEIYLKQPWVHTAWKFGELASYSGVLPMPVMCNVYIHDHYSEAEARYKALQVLANGVYPNFWSTPAMKSVYSFLRRNADCFDYATTAPVRCVALPRDVSVDAVQQAAPTASGVSYQRDRFLNPYVGIYSALSRSSVPVSTLFRPDFEKHLKGFRVLCLANVLNLTDAQVEAVRQFVEQGGGLLATHETSLCEGNGKRRSDFALGDVLGVRYKTVLKTASRTIAFNAKHDVVDGVTRSEPLVHDEPHLVVEPTTARSVAVLQEDAGGLVPAVLVNEFGKGRVVYLPGRLDSMQCQQPAPQIERLFKNAVRWLAHGNLPVELEAKAPVGVTVFEQANRWIVHLVNYNRDSRFADDRCDVIQNVAVTLRPPANKRVARVRRLWEPTELEHTRDGEKEKIRLNSLSEYEAVVVDWH